MAVLTSKDKNELIVTCKCGCEDSVHLVINESDYDHDEYAFMMFMNGSFVSEQGKTFWRVLKEKIKKIWAIIANKDFYYHDIRMSKDDFEMFKEYINSKGE